MMNLSKLGANAMYCWCVTVVATGDRYSRLFRLHIILQQVCFYKIPPTSPKVTQERLTPTMAVNTTSCSQIPYLTKYERVVLISTRAMELANNEKPYIGLDPKKKTAVVICPGALPFPSFLNDTINIVALELGLDTLDENELVRDA